MDAKVIRRTAPNGAVEKALAEHAAVIRALGKRVIRDIIEIGRRLADAKERLGHGNFLPWIDTEFGWSIATAERFIQVHENVGSKIVNLTNLDLPVSGLYVLAAPSTPDEAREEVIGRAEAGEHLSVTDVQRIVDDALFKQADKSAAELRERIARREQEVRDEYAGKLVLDPATLNAEIAKAIDTAIAPLQRDLERAEKKLKAAQDQLEAKAVEQPQGPKVDSELSLKSTSVALALKALGEKVATVTPQQMIEVEVASASHTQQTPADRLGETRDHAIEVVRWLNEFIAAKW
ncbi:DUF3102 domain-containing protein [Bradyrhizobium sp. USDA 313]|uniref:DUF3102 domain-containing protein n=1 Tax=Bradyrhizobium sp. USDA 313 TaxID=3156307 RepID=UPI003512878C